MKQNPEILIVDDEASLREICRDALEDAGYEVHEAKDGKEALDFLIKKSVDLVITDLRMPVMNGLELLKKVKELELDPSFLVMTGFGTIETAVESMKVGADDYLPKPFNISHLLLKVEKVISERKSREERKKLSNLVRMLNLSSAMNSQLDLRSLINEFIFHLQKSFSPNSIAFFLESSKNDALTPAAIRGEIFRDEVRLLAWVKKQCGIILEKGQSRLVESLWEFSKDGSDDGCPQTEKDFSLLVVPLTNKFKKIGVVALIREIEKKKYGAPELQLLTIFAAHTASSVENARLYGQLQDLTMQIIRSYANAVEAKDIYTRGHSDRVALYATQLGRALGLNSDELDLLYTAGVLHDIGKIGIPDVILNKPSALTAEEFEIIKKHPEIGKSILYNVDSLRDAIPIIYHHHERFDGKGYPDQLHGDDIPFLARVICVVDSFEAMTSDRAYRNAMGYDRVVGIFESGAGSQWDTHLVQVWLDIIRKEKKEAIIAPTLGSQALHLLK